MGEGKGLETGGRHCITDGCDKFARPRSTSGKCPNCIARECYHRKNPDSPSRPMGHHGKWKGVECSEDGCSERASTNGLCHRHSSTAAYYRRKADGVSYCPTSRRNAHLKLKYGIDAADYTRMFESQDGKCAICGMGADEVAVPSSWSASNPFAVDHCHESGKVRALLCNQCNLLVHSGQTSDTLQRAIQYLEHHQRNS